MLRQEGHDDEFLDSRGAKLLQPSPEEAKVSNVCRLLSDYSGVASDIHRRGRTRRNWLLDLFYTHSPRTDQVRYNLFSFFFLYRIDTVT